MTAVFGEGVVYDSDPKKRNTQMQRTAAALKSSRLKTYVEKIIKASCLKPATNYPPYRRARAEQSVVLVR